MSPLAYLESQQAARPDLAIWYAEMAELYIKKLWHQLTIKVEEFISLAILQSGDLLVHLYHNFISDFELKINPLKLARCIVIISRQYGDKDSAIAFLEAVLLKLKSNNSRRVEEPILYIQMQIAALKLQGGDPKGCKALLDESQQTLQNLSDIDPTVHSSVHWVTSQYHKGNQDFAGFYRSSLLYLSYTSIETLAEPFKLDLVVDLSLASLLGEGVYNFGELIGHPIVDVLNKSNYGWLLELLKAFDRGDLYTYDHLCEKYAAQLNAQPALVQNERKLREKITLLSLLELIFSRAPEERTIPFSVIASKAKLPLPDVELLLMKALSVKLIEGVINQVDETVQITWVQPRVLSVPQIAELRDRLSIWISKVHAAVQDIESETPDLVVS